MHREMGGFRLQPRAKSGRAAIIRIERIPGQMTKQMAMSITPGAFRFRSRGHTEVFAPHQGIEPCKTGFGGQSVPST